uniref:Secreted protein n=1 Tax=Strongyloides venezuelensis TaxID=75913 RepID=A0A0K0EW45_STRVS
MNFQSIFILLVTILSTSIGYKVEESSNGVKVCMTPHESAYQDVFLTLIPDNILSLGFEIESYDSDSYDYNTINKKIKDNIDQKVMESFAQSLGTFTYKNPTNVTVVSDLSQCSGTTYNY